MMCVFVCEMCVYVYNVYMCLCVYNVYVGVIHMCVPV